MMTWRISGAPICAGGASPLRVATGGSANWSSGVRSRRSPARANRRRDSVLRGLEDASLFQSSENHGEPLTHIGHLFMTNPRASLRSDNCPISIGMGVRFGLEQVSAFVGIRSRYAQAPELLILADGGGSNGPRCRAWKLALQEKLADPFELVVTVCHYPTGASKWNPVEHRVFSEISKHWAGQPLADY